MRDMGAGIYSSALLLLFLSAVVAAATTDGSPDGTQCLPAVKEGMTVMDGQLLGSWQLDDEACAAQCCDMARCDMAVLGPQGDCELFACPDTGCKFVAQEETKVRFEEPHIQPATAEQTGETPDSEEDVCRLPQKVGRCRARLTRWFYNPESGSCETFSYGGCMGNGNNFELEEECIQRCVGGEAPEVKEPQRVLGLQEDEQQDEHHSPTTSPEHQVDDQLSSEPPLPFSLDDCLSAPDKGPCRGSYWRWFYTAETGHCKKFEYGGCQGNSNNFHGYRECLSSCGPEREPRSGQGRTMPSYEFCLLEVTTGGCRGSFTRWVYTPDNGSCSEFIYGGCRGNENNFLLEVECLATCGLQNGTAGTTRTKPKALNPAEVCLLEPKVGPCRGSFTRWTYDAATSTCKEFTYGGCRGDHNNFLEEEECLQACGPSAGDDHALFFRATAPPEDVCLLEEDVGPCRGSFTRWIYDAETGACREFTYGGCSGNLNNFLEETECMAKCGQSLEEGGGKIRLADTEIPPDVCLLEAVTGPCRGSFTRWTYDADIGHCKELTYGGCGGNYNNFLEVALCEATCGLQDGSVGIEDEETMQQILVHKFDADVCLLEPFVGPCRGSFTRWAYDAESSHCKEFTYGGCRGNHNNFVDEADCKGLCAPFKGSNSRLFDSVFSDEDFCKAEPVTGPCRAHFHRWFYSESTSGCTKFTYGGCAGGLNNHLTEDACLDVCKGPRNDKTVDNAGSTQVVVGVLFGLLIAILMVVIVVWKLRRARQKQERNGTATTNGTATSTAVDAPPVAGTKDENVHLMAELPHSSIIGKQSSV